MKTFEDRFDRLREQWRNERPDLDPSAVETITRIFFLAKQLRRKAAQELAKHGLAFRDYEILATLRRQGPPFQLTPSELGRAARLSPAAMTFRLDSLESANWIKRKPDPSDRRRLLVELTPTGLELVDRAATTRHEEAKESIGVLSEPERREFNNLLRKLLREGLTSDPGLR